jgi:hypothetical protein
MREQIVGKHECPANLHQPLSKRCEHLAIFLRGHLDSSAIPEGVRKQVQSVDPTLPVFSAEMLTKTVSASLDQRRFVRNRRFVCSDGVAFGGYRNVRNAFLPGQRNERAKSGSGSRSARSDGRFCKCCYNMGSDSPSPVLPLALSLRCFFQI